MRFIGAPEQVVFGADGKMDEVTFSVARGGHIFFISTKEMPGHVVLLEEAQEDAEKSLADLIARRDSELVALNAPSIVPDVA